MGEHGGSGLDIPPEVPCPGGCGRWVRPEFDTDGCGDVVELVEPCRHCRPSRLIVVPPGSRVLVCERCDRSFVRCRQVGPPRRYCPDCR